MTTLTATANEIRTAGIAALTKELGPVGAIRFMQLFDNGSGDYTANRDRIHGNPTLEELLQETRAMRQQPPQ